MISKSARRIAQQESFNKTELWQLLEPIIDEIQINYFIAINANGQGGPFGNDYENICVTAACNLRQSLQDLEDLLYPKEAKERIDKEDAAEAEFYRRRYPKFSIQLQDNPEAIYPIIQADNDPQDVSPE